MGMPIAERLAKKRTLLEWLRWQVVVTEREIRDLEREDAEERRRREVAHRELRWTMSEPRAVEGHPVLHRGNCSLAAQYGGVELLDREGVIAAAEMHPDLELCDVCAPWGSLGIDKPADRPAARTGIDEFP
ncbi:DUF6233 domain-containing protein [Streptomyces gardneri]|uniref:DUF6233 domain-containing protein n=1 Tax=Streptomyces gardneri TaxID=66892 RepID=UPI0036BF718E